VISHFHSPIRYSRSRRIIAGFLASVTTGLLVISPATSADLHNASAPEAHDMPSPITNPAQPALDPEKNGSNGSMEELLPVPGEEDPGQGNDTPLIVVPPIERPSQRYFLSSFKLPSQLTFAGVSVPMDNWQVRERIEYEFYQFLAEEGESIIMAKRTGRCFPPVEKQLAQSGLPDDLKYMLLVESKCIAAAFSKAKASGPWQFIGSTGKRYKLYSNQWRDDRRNLEMSTEAAIKYLRYLKQDLGDWFLAMAAYNAGEDRIRKLLKEQRITDYWKLHYVRETMRYVPRIIAAKEIYSQSEKYLGLTKKDLYAQLETETVAVTIKESQRHLASIAQDYGSYFLELKMLNPEISKAYLPKGTHSLRVPKQACPFRCLKQGATP
jgi:membrane-bound lytic murein transglycosylase D